MVIDRPRRTRNVPVYLQDDSEDGGRRSEGTSRAGSRSGSDLPHSSARARAPAGGEAPSAGASAADTAAGGGDAGAAGSVADARQFFADFVDGLLAMDDAEGFHLPVQELWEDSAIPDYFDIVKEPMDLGTVRARLGTDHYVHDGTLDEAAVTADVRLTFTNCMRYNTAGSAVYLAAQRLLTHVDTALEERVDAARRARKRARDRDRRRRQKEHAERQKEHAERQRRAQQAAADAAPHRPQEARASRAAQEARAVAPGETALVGDAQKRPVRETQPVEPAGKDEVRKARDRKEARRRKSMERRHHEEQMDERPLDGRKSSERRKSEDLNEEEMIERKRNRERAQIAAADESRKRAAEDVAIEAHQRRKKARKKPPRVLQYESEEQRRARLAAAKEKIDQLVFAERERTDFMRLVEVMQVEDMVAAELRYLEEDDRRARPGLLPDKEEDVGESESSISFRFMRIDGLRMRKGPKSSVVQALEKKHGELMLQYRRLMDLQMSLKHMETVPMSTMEKERLMFDISELSFFDMKAAIEIIAYGSNRLELLELAEVEIDLDRIENSVLREAEMYIQNTDVPNIEEALYTAEKDVTRVEAFIILLLYLPGETSSVKAEKKMGEVTGKPSAATESMEVERPLPPGNGHAAVLGGAGPASI